MADKAPCAYGVSGYVVVEKTQPARGGAGPTDEELAQQRAVERRIATIIAQHDPENPRPPLPPLGWHWAAAEDIYQAVMARAVRQAGAGAPGATGATGGGA